MFNRRTFIKSAVIAAASPSVAVSPAKALSPLTDLMERHKAAMAADKIAWRELADLSEKLENDPDHKLPKVQVGNVVRYGGEGVPRFCYCEEDIIGIISQHLEARVALCGRREDLKQKARQGYQAVIDEKVAELNKLKAEYRAREDAAGVTAAHQAALASANAVRKLEAEIVAFAPASMDEAVSLASWICSAWRNEDCYIYSDSDSSECEPLFAALQAIASAGRSA